jgi:hypothetical protein
MESIVRYQHARKKLEHGVDDGAGIAAGVGQLPHLGLSPQPSFRRHPRIIPVEGCVDLRFILHPS